MKAAFENLEHALQRYHANADDVVYGNGHSHRDLPDDSANSSAILFYMAEQFKAGGRFAEGTELPPRVAKLQSEIADGVAPQTALRTIHAPFAARYYEMYHPEECGQHYSALREM